MGYGYDVGLQIHIEGKGGRIYISEGQHHVGDHQCRVILGYGDLVAHTTAE
jgi:hypothetical protein